MQLVLFIGIPGSGKSTFYQQYFFHTHVRVNLDMLRTRNRENKLLDFCFQTMQPLVVDNTNVTLADRQKYILLAKKYRFRITGYYFETQLEEAILRNAQRNGRQLVSEKGIKAKYYQLQPPSFEEGFDELSIVHVEGDGRFIVNPLLKNI